MEPPFRMCKFPQFVSHHILCHKYRYVVHAVMDHESNPGYVDGSHPPSTTSPELRTQQSSAGWCTNVHRSLWAHDSQEPREDPENPQNTDLHLTENSFHRSAFIEDTEIAHLSMPTVQISVVVE